MKLDQKFTLGFKVKKGKLIYEILEIISNSRETKGKYIVADLTTNGNNDEEFDRSFGSVLINDGSQTQVIDDHLEKVVLSDLPRSPILNSDLRVTYIIQRKKYLVNASAKSDRMASMDLIIGSN